MIRNEIVHKWRLVIQFHYCEAGSHQPSSCNFSPNFHSFTFIDSLEVHAWRSKNVSSTELVQLASHILMSTGLYDIKIVDQVLAWRKELDCRTGTVWTRNPDQLAFPPQNPHFVQFQRSTAFHFQLSLCTTEYTSTNSTICIRLRWLSEHCKHWTRTAMLAFTQAGAWLLLKVNQLLYSLIKWPVPTRSHGSSVRLIKDFRVQEFAETCSTACHHDRDLREGLRYCGAWIHGRRLPRLLSSRGHALTFVGSSGRLK